MKKVIITIAVTIAIVISAIFANGCYYVFYGQFKTVDKIHNNIQISLYEKCSIYTMHMATYTFGWVYSPEAAYCNLLMCFPHNKNYKVYYNTDCWLTPKIRSHIKNKEYGKITWSGNAHSGQIGDYNIKSPEHRAAILLNWCILDETPKYYTATCEYSYKVPSATEFYVGKLKIIINEQLFYELEKCGWLHPYILVCYVDKDKLTTD